MKVCAIVLGTLLSVLSIGVVMKPAGWLSGVRSPRQQPRTVQVRPEPIDDPLTGEAGWRYRKNQPSNWRVLMMYR